MSTLYSVGQMNQVADGCETAGFSPDDMTKLRNPDLLAQIKLVILGIAFIVKANFKLALDKAFSPSGFISNDWSVWKGPADDNGLEGKEEAVSEPDVVDFEQIVLETHL